MADEPRKYSLRYYLSMKLDNIIAVFVSEGYEEKQVVNELLNYLNTKPL